MRYPLVTIARMAWRDLLAQACGHRREGGGLLIGRHTRYNNFIIERVTGMTHADATEDHVFYNHEEVAAARVSAFEVYKPLEPIGAWHTHPFSVCCKEALVPQISDDWNDPQSDVSDMLDGDIELILPIFAWPGYWLPSLGDMRVQSRLGNVLCYAEPWLRISRGRLLACRMKVR